MSDHMRPVGWRDPDDPSPWMGAGINTTRQQQGCRRVTMTGLAVVFLVILAVLAAGAYQWLAS